MNAKFGLFGSSKSPYMIYLPGFSMKYRLLLNGGIDGIVDEPTPVT